MKSYLAYRVFCLLDHLVWLSIQLLPGSLLISLAQKRPWQRLRFSLVPQAKNKWEDRISWLLRTRCRRANYCSTCLSRSLSGRLLLDLIGVDNELHLGMSKFSNGCKIPHAWLAKSNNGKLLTPGLTPKQELLSFKYEPCHFSCQVLIPNLWRQDFIQVMLFIEGLYFQWKGK